MNSQTLGGPFTIFKILSVLYLYHRETFRTDCIVDFTKDVVLIVFEVQQRLIITENLLFLLGRQ